ncbi:MAG: RNA polymerase sigma factor [Acidimicrobiales bacterium]
MEDDLRSIYQTTLPHVFGYLMMHTAGNRALAEDLTAETYLHATRHVHNGLAADVTVPWLKTVARRRLVDHWRREASQARRAERLGDQLALVPDVDETDLVFERRRIEEALSGLSADQRIVLVMKHLDGLSIGQIAAHMSRSEDGVASLLSRARAAFRLMYGGTIDA